VADRPTSGRSCSSTCT